MIASLQQSAIGCYESTMAALFDGYNQAKDYAFFTLENLDYEKAAHVGLSSIATIGSLYFAKEYHAYGQIKDLSYFFFLLGCGGGELSIALTAEDVKKAFNGNLKEQAAIISGIAFSIFSFCAVTFYLYEMMVAFEAIYLILSIVQFLIGVHGFMFYEPAMSESTALHAKI